MKTSLLTRRLSVLTWCVVCACSLLCSIRADGLPGEYLISDEWRRLLAYYSPVSNPAFMTEQNYTSVRGAFALSLDGPSRLFEAGAMTPIGLYQSAGFSAIVENGKVLDSTGYIDATGRFYASSERLQNTNALFIGSYAINPWGRLSLGANLNVAYQTNFGDPTVNVGGDLGVSWRLLRHSLLGDHTFGITYQNFLGSQYSIGDAPGYAEQLRSILHSKYAESRFESTIEFDVTDIAAKPENFASGDAAVEWGMTVQAGAWLLRILKVHAFFGLHGNRDGGEIDAWGLAGGINAPMINNGRDFNVEYQFRDELNQSLMATHSLYVRFDIGMHREEIYARKMARLASLLPNELYNRALKLYHEGKYWDAYFVFGKILARYPDFFKNDMVTYYRGSCLEEMDMRDRAAATYERVRTDYPRSGAMALADLGIMRIAYRNDDRYKVEQQFNLLSGDQVMDSLKYHAYYFMGQTAMRSGENAKAVRLLAVVPEIHPEYVFAQHSMGILNIMELDLDNAMRAFENCLQAQIRTPAQKEVFNRSCLFLGYLFYEQNSLSKAVTALRMVPHGSYYYEDALLGLGWCAIKARQWTDCINIGTALAQLTRKPILQYEAALIKAYGLLMDKSYEAGYNELKSIAGPLSALQPPLRDSLEAATRRNEQVRFAYEQVAQKAEDLSLIEESSFILKQADSLHLRQIDILQKLKAHQKYVDEFGRLMLFGRSIDKVREDVDYAMAVLEKITKRASTIRVQEKLQEKRKDIDAEIQKIEKEMEKIEGEKSE